MEIHIKRYQVNKKQILEDLSSDLFQDSYIDSNLKEISENIFKIKNIKVDDFSDIIFQNTYIVFIDSNSNEIKRLSFDDIISIVELDEDDIEEAVNEIGILLPDNFELNIIFSANDGIFEKQFVRKEDEKLCSFLNNKVRYKDINWIGFTESYNKDFPPSEEIPNKPRIMLYIELSSLDKTITLDDNDFNPKEAIEFFNVLFEKYNILIPIDSLYLIQIENNFFNIYLFMDNEIIKKLKKLKLLNSINLGFLFKTLKGKSNENQ